MAKTEEKTVTKNQKGRLEAVQSNRGFLSTMGFIKDFNIISKVHDT